MNTMNENQLADLYNTYCNYLNRFQDENINKFLEENGERLLLSSYGLKKDDPYCGPGGIIKYAIDSFTIATKLSKAVQFDVNQDEISIKSLALITLFGVVGRMGDLENEQFVEQKSEWHRNKLGQLYDWNPSCQKMSIPHRSLFLLQHYNIKLTYQEMLGIICSEGMHLEENKFYVNDLPIVSKIAMMAFDLAYENERKFIKLNTVNS
jgi:hypothetical protein